jgi:hypothetical protein
VSTSGPNADPQLRELLDMEISDIVATANTQGFSTRDILEGLSAAVSGAILALDVDPDPAEDPSALPAGPHPSPELVDESKTPGTGA